MTDFNVEGKIVDCDTETIFQGLVHVKNGKIAEIIKGNTVSSTEVGPFITPGFIDGHFHVEDTSIAPYEFSRLVVGHGTIAAVCDPHEIANVMGIPGVDYIIETSKASPFKFFYGASPCVPATQFETSGAKLGPKEIQTLMKRPDIYFLGEFMDYPAVISGDPIALAKIQAAKDCNKLIDGHCPGLTGCNLDKYIAAGVSSDHECSTLEEAEEKMKKGMGVLVREGSAALNLAALYPMIDKYPKETMLCTDDTHPDDLNNRGHIDYVVKRALGYGCNIFNVLRAASINIVKHYKFPIGCLRVGDPADFIVVNSLKELKVLQTYIDGKLVFDCGKPTFPFIQPKIINNFGIGPIKVEDIEVPAKSETVKVIGVIDMQLITEKNVEKLKANARGLLESDPQRDILKIIVVNRYFKTAPSIGFIKGYGLKSGAMAISISHDSHNILCVGVSDEDITKAINLVIKYKGGVVAVGKGQELVLPLPICGLMSDLPFEEIGKKYGNLQSFAKDLGCKLSTPFPTLSFMALTCIPALKISDKGLIDSDRFKQVSIYDEF